MGSQFFDKDWEVGRQTVQNILIFYIYFKFILYISNM
jgi:phosphate starvation-inducible membrane PsiE